MKDVLGINGHVKLEFTRKNGDVDVFEYENTVTDAFKEKVTDALVTSTDFALDDLMQSADEQVADGDGISEATHTDGIAIRHSVSTEVYPTDCTTGTYGITENADNIVVKGWTDREGTYDQMALGRTLTGTGDSDGSPVFSNKTIAHTIGSGDSLLITWTFNIG